MNGIIAVSRTYCDTLAVKSAIVQGHVTINMARMVDSFSVGNVIVAVLYIYCMCLPMY